MAGIKYKDYILEAIDLLRKRKARPDLERICLMVMRKHGLSFEDIVLDLEKLVEENIVIKVDFKGNISYRNAATKRKGSSCNSIENLNKVYEAFVTINKETEKDGEVGAGIDTVENWLLENDYDIDRDVIIASTQQLLNEGKVKETENETFVPVNSNGNMDIDHDINMEVAATTSGKQKSPKEKTKNKVGAKPKKGQSLAQNAPTTTSRNSPGLVDDALSPGKKGRPPTKRKRIKKTHGPDFETYFVPTPTKLSKRRGSGDNKKEDRPNTSRKSSPTNSNESDVVCDFCLKGVDSNRDGCSEQLLFCKDCRAKAHPSCMDYSPELAKRALVSPWQCIDCKVCYVCEDSGDADAMLFCDACDKGYHMDCHNPPITEKPTGKWVCSRCADEDEKESKTSLVVNGSVNGHDGDSNSTILPTPRESPVFQMPEFKPQIMMPSLPSQPCSNSSLLQILPSFKKYINKEVPDASVWTISQVGEYFTDAGFGDHAQVFQEQEIDGKSLLLLKRSDVLQGLGIKIGPALKMYAHIQRLQTKGQLIL